MGLFTTLNIARRNVRHPARNEFQNSFIPALNRLDLASIPKQNVFIDVFNQFGVTASGINNAIEFARNTFNLNPEAEIVLYIKQGEYFIDNTLHFDNIKPGSGGRLTITGDSDSNTVLISDNFKDTLKGENVSRVTIANIHFTRDKVITSQGIVSSVEPGWIILQINVEKFSRIENIFNSEITTDLETWLGLSQSAAVSRTMLIGSARGRRSPLRTLHGPGRPGECSGGALAK